MAQNALAIIDKARRDGALVYVPENLEVPPLYKVEASVIEVEPRDFHDIQGKLVPRKEIVDKIGDAAGVDFIASQCGVKTESHDDDFGRRTVYVGYAQGRVRISDGSWRQSSVEEYEFDPVLRAKAEGGGEKKILEYSKVARQRASTGARMRVIRQLTGMPTAFEKQDVKTGTALTFSRVVQNTDYILGTKEGRIMAIAQATGMAAQLYGPKAGAPAEAQSEPFESSESEPRNVTPQRETEAESDPFGDPVDAAASADPEVEKLQQALHEYIASGYLREAGVKMCQAALDRGESDPIILRDLVSKAKAAYDARARATV